MVRGGFSAHSTAKLLLCATVMLPAHLSGFMVRRISVAKARAFARSTPSVSFAGGPRVPIAARATPSFSSSSVGGGSDNYCPLEFKELPYRGAEVRVSARDLGLHVDGRVSHDDDKSATTCSTSSDAQFLDDLRSSLKYWSDHDYTSAWLHIPASRAGLVELLTSEATSTRKEHATTDTDTDTAADLSFDLHHVNATESTIVLKKWLRPNAEDKIPPFASHQVGCAGFVLSEDNELLLVREWAGPPSNRTPTKQWKLPGGLLDAGESFEEATCREVKEETGINCRFESVLSFWHRHGLVFGKSDFYYVSLLNPVSKDIDIDPVEVSACKWMPIEEFLASQDHPLILHVLDKVFELKNDGESLEKVRNHKGRLRPIVDMAENDVQFGNRDPFPTYTGRISR